MDQLNLGSEAAVLAIIRGKKIYSELAQASVLRTYFGRWTGRGGQLFPQGTLYGR